MISSNKDCIYTNMLTNKDIDIDEKFDIQAIKEVKYDHEENSFYILANKLGGKLGFFVIKMQASAPENYKFLVRWKNKLDIDDTKIVVLRDRKKGYKELCISFKTIFINTFNVMILDMKQDPKYSKNSIIFRHESFQLWESKCDSALLSKNNDFIIILGKKIIINGDMFDSTNLIKKIDSKSENSVLANISKDIQVNFKDVLTKWSIPIKDFNLIVSVR